MPYQFTCPLCLVTLGQRHTLRVFKIADAGANRNNPPKKIECGNPNFIDEILKFSGEDAFVPIDEYAVYVSHEKCEAVNPFWASDKLEMPGKYSDGEQFLANLTCVRTEKQFQSLLSYWMVKILRETYKLGNDYRPMWYPLQLLLATASDGTSRTRPYGSLVEMASSKSVGKTILTLQILNQALYRNGREVTVRDFFYPNADLEDVTFKDFREKFYNEVFYHSMWKRTPISRPFGTVASAGDLRAIFIQPVLPEDRPIQSQKRHADGRFKRGLSRFVINPFLIFVKGTFTLESPEKKKEQQPAPKFEDVIAKCRDEYWSPIIFYDTAGELQETMGMVTKSVRQLTNKLAICVDAREIFNRYEPFMPEDTVTPVTERNTSIRHAHKRLSELQITPRRRKGACIIVTKLDLVLSGADKEKVKAIAEDPDADESARKLLIEWLTAHSDYDKENLRSLILKDQKLVEKVFFVWTENLPRMKGVRRSPIKRIDPPSGRSGDEIILEVEPDFDFEDAKRVTFNGTESRYTIVSKEKIKAIVPETATSGLVGILLEGIPKGLGQTSTTYRDEATSNVPFTVLPEISSDASKPRSYGLIKFLAWCLDKKIEEISRPTGY
jgi:hypothetical protein